MRSVKARSDKASKRLRGVKSGTGLKLSKAIHTVNVYAKVPVVISGFLVSRSANFVVFRHRKSSGSKKTRITTFPRNVVIEVFGNVGEPGQITVWKKNLINTLKGHVTLSEKQGAIRITDLVNEEPTVIYLSDHIEVDVFADEEEKAQRLPKRKKGAKKSKAEDEDDDSAVEDDDSDEEDFEEEEEVDEDDDADEDDDSDESDDEDEDEPL